MKKKMTITSLLRGVMGIVASAALTACDGMIYDDGGECETTYSVTFTYTMNTSYADAFAHYAPTVTLCAFDGDGTLAYTKTVDGATLAANGQTMDVSDITPGTYTIVAWAEGETVTDGCYEYGGLTVGSTKTDDVTCRLTRDDDGGAGWQLTPLFHGMAEDADLTEPSGGGERNVTVDLTKDTNELTVILQHLSGEAVDAADFSFSVTDNNGTLAYDNSLLADDITYQAYETATGEATLYDDDEEDDSAQTTVSAAIARFSLNRLFADGDTRLTISDGDGARVLSIPVTDYALLVKSNYGELTDQEYLDREDDYSMTFFLDESGSWYSASIIINGWRVVMEDMDM